jgi:SAM-dependent methyltransferase
MSCLSRVIGCLSYALEQLGLYEPEISIREARDRLSLESKLWEKTQDNRDEFWSDFQADNTTTGPLPTLVERAITHLKNHHVYRGVAVDLGCGINTTTFNLLERGWKVYAIESSDAVIKTLAQKVSSMGENWIRNGQLVLVKQAIEEFKYPEKVHLVTAIDSLPYCDPKKINKIFLEVKNALLPQGVFVCNLFPYNDNPIVDGMLRGMFGAWTTTKNVVEAVIRSVDFSSWSVTEGKSQGGLAKQFHIFAQS